MKSLGQKIKQCGGLIDTADVSAWENEFLQSVVSRTNDGADAIEDLMWIVERTQIVLLPMAKGYAAEHPVGNNAEMVADMEERLSNLGPSWITRCTNCGQPLLEWVHHCIPACENCGATEQPDRCSGGSRCLFPPHAQNSSKPGYLGDVNGPGCDPDTP